ncbi:mannosyl-glycoprotein endo-beta-N-acetylglucosamidase [Enterococcus hirae]|nr:mannosyl-glycoprotein endo-beta-N-acetylglucosamidase [Enterococcus hirae]
MSTSATPSLVLAETLTIDKTSAETAVDSTPNEEEKILSSQPPSTPKELDALSDEVPEISGNPSLSGRAYPSGISKPTKIVVTATEHSQEDFVEAQSSTAHSYVGSGDVFEIHTTDLQLPTTTFLDAAAIHLAMPTDNSIETLQTLAYYIAKKIKTYNLPLDHLSEIISIDSQFTLDEDQLFEWIQVYSPQITGDARIQTKSSLSNNYAFLQNTKLYPSVYRQLSDVYLTGNVLLTEKVELSDHTTWFFVQNATQSGWVPSETITPYEPQVISQSNATGKLAEKAKIYQTLSDAWIDQSSIQNDSALSNLVAKKIQIGHSIFYELFTNNKLIGYVQKETFQSEHDTPVPDTSKAKTAENKIPDSSSESTTKPPTKDQSSQRTAQPSINYSTHVKNLGWLPAVSDGQLSGTTGRLLQIEAFRLNVASSIQGSIEYTSYVQQSGWQGWVSNDNVSGTIGQVKRIEGINIRLTGQLASGYNIFYRVHVKNLGWLPWASNGKAAGTIGYGYHIEAIEVRLVSLSQTGPSTGVSYLEKEPSILANTHITNKGWLGEKDASTFAGTTGQNLSLQALRLRISENTIGGDISYQSHIANRGWETNWSSNTTTSGTTGLNLPIEAVRLSLTGAISTRYDIYYRLHVQNFGWLDWATNGESAGTQGYAAQAEAVQIKLLPKGATPPGQTVRSFRIAPPKITFQGHLSTTGWVSRTGITAPINFANQRRQFEAIRATLASSKFSGSIRYDSHIASNGWTRPVSNGDISGTTGQNRSLQAFSFQLTEELANHYDIYYRSFVRSKGWLGWASNGQKSGSVGMSLPVEAIEVTIVENDRKPSGYQANQLTILGQVDDTTPQGKFINSISQSANRIAPTYGLYTSVMLAQAILETGYGTSVLAQQAKNFFGMKFKEGEDEGKYNYIWHVSNEVVNGQTIAVNSKFRVYQTTDSSFLDNAVKLKYGVSWDPHRYKGTWKINTNSYRDATRALTGTYATDPNYGDKLNSVIDYWKLYQFD